MKVIGLRAIELDGSLLHLDAASREAEQDLVPNAGATSRKTPAQGVC